MPNTEKKMSAAKILSYLAGMERKADCNYEKQVRKQNQRIKELMSKAYEIPFYRARFDSIGCTPADFQTAEDLRKFPLLSKQEFHDWMAVEVQDEKYTGYFVDNTSGSSGRPTSILYSPDEKAWSVANWFRVLFKAGYNPFFGKTMSRHDKNDSTKESGLIQKLGIMRRKFVSQYDPEEEVIEQINSYKPDLLYMNKTEFDRVALYAKRHSMQVWHPRFIIPVGEKIDDASVELYHEVFGIYPTDSFGTAEVGACMLKLPGTDYHRIHHDSFVVDTYEPPSGFFDESVLSSKMGSLGVCEHADHGLLAVTPLQKTDIPLINYVVGDYAQLDKIGDEPIVRKIEGRSTDMIVHEDGSMTSFFMIDGVIAHCEGAVQVQVVQESLHELTVRVVLDESAGKLKEETEQYLAEGFKGVLRQPMDIAFEWVDFLSAEKNGKLKVVVSNIKREPIG